MIRSLVAATLLAVSTASQVPGQGDTARTVRVPSDSAALEAMTTALASELRCPVCQGNSIQDSPSELALQMRDVIRDQLRAGKTPDEVRAYFVDKYGEWILLSPKAQGLNLIVYIVPFVALLLGGLIVWRTVRKWTHAPAADTNSSSTR